MKDAKRISQTHAKGKPVPRALDYVDKLADGMLDVAAGYFDDEHEKLSRIGKGAQFDQAMLAHFRELRALEAIEAGMLDAREVAYE